MKKLLFLLCILSLVSTQSYCQGPDSVPVDSTQLATKIYDLVEVSPEPVKGYVALFSFLSRTVEYPQEALVMGSTGTVYVKFVVTDKGKITRPEVVKGVNVYLDLEAIRVLELAADSISWIPGKQGGVPVSVWKTLPIKFAIHKATLKMLWIKENQQGDNSASAKSVVTDNGPKVVDTLNGKPVFINPSKWPLLRGHSTAQSKFINENFNYPAAAMGAEGEVIVSFIVTAPDGVIADMHISQSVDSVLDAEALQLVKLINTEFGWEAGSISKSKVHTRIEYPVKFDFTKENTINLFRTLEANPSLMKDSASAARPAVDTLSNGMLVYLEPDEPPMPLGGMENLYAFLVKNMKYPAHAENAGKEGTVFVRVTIDEEGKVLFAEALKERRAGFGLEKEAIRAVKLTEWVPAVHKGEKVKSRMILPIKFRLLR